MAEHSEILVCVDGSIPSNIAMRWAASEARARDVGLLLVHVVDSQPYLLWTEARGLRADMRRLAEPILADAVVLLSRSAPDVSVRTKVIIGPVAKTLLRLAASAGLTVVGPRGRGALSSVWLGSVTQRIIAHAARPVVSVGRRSTTERRVGVQRVVVALHDQRPASPAVLDFAYHEAAWRGVPLLVLHSVADSDSTAVDDLPTGVQSDVVRHQVSESLQSWASAYPSVETSVFVRHGDPVEAIRETCNPSDLLVLGQHHRGVLAHRLGRITAAVLREADCPVAVVPDTSAASSSGDPSDSASAPGSTGADPDPGERVPEASPQPGEGKP